MKFGPVLILTSVLSSSIAAADIAYFESEPNNTPEEFNPVSGAVTLYGSMAGNDQDGFVWTVSDDDARKRWTFELHGIPGAALTQVDVVRLEYAENGVDITGKRNLFKMGTRDGTRPSIHPGLMFDPGEYVLGVSQRGAGTDEGAYRFFIREQSPSVYPNPSAGTTMDDAYKVRPGGSFATFEPNEIAWYRFNFSESDATSRWAIAVQVPVGRKLEASLHDANGEELVTSQVDEKGRTNFRDLAPPAGSWFIKLQTREPGMFQSISLESTGVRIEGQEAEPNNDKKLANRVNLSQPLTGRIGDGDSEDMFVFTVDDSDTPSLYTLNLDSSNPGKLNFCLKSSEWKDIQCRFGTPPLTMPDLLLPPGEWGLHLRRAEAQDYTITFKPQGPMESGREVEPNDETTYATGVSSKMRIKGRFSGDDTDYYQFHITGEAQLWRFQVNGSNFSSIGYLDGRGKEKATVRAGNGDTRVRLDNIFLLPGRHYIRVRGTDSDYTLLARALGAPVAAPSAVVSPDAPATAQPAAPGIPEAMWNPDGEVEPNDKYNMQRLAIGQTRTGTLPDTVDKDYYRFFVANYDHLKITIEPPGDGSVHPYLYWYDYQLGSADNRQPGEVIEFEGLMPPGDYQLLLQTEDPSDEPYRLKLERLPRFACGKDCEPNGMKPLDNVAPWPADLRLQGTAQTWRDQDVYHLPSFDHDTEVFIRTETALDRAYLADASGEESSYLQFDKDQGGHRITLPAGKPQRLVITGRGAKPYDAQLEFPNGELQPVTGSLMAQMSMELTASTVSAFLEHGQRVTGKLKIENPGASPMTLTLTAVTSDYRWSVALEKNTVTIEGGGHSIVPVEVTIPSDAWADHTVRISVQAQDDEGRPAEAWSDIAVNRTTPAVNAQLFWPIPDSLRGGFNAAWLPFGSEMTDDAPPKTQQPLLRDDLVFPRATMSCCASHSGWKSGSGPTWTIDLPGDAPLPVAGVALDSFGARGIANTIRRATFLLSEDGVNYQEALQLEALPVLTEQHFPLPSPIHARFAQLQINSTYEYPSGEVETGEWKVILEPGFDLSAGQGFNIADPALGGHLVWTLPADAGAGRILVDEDKSLSAKLGKNTSLEYVIGFKRDRAAQIEKIDWVYHESAAEGDRNFRTIAISASEHSPVGPWRSLGKLELKAADTSATLNLDSPAWARFVRFEPELDPEAKRAKEPGLIRIWERPGGDDYYSVLTEWGESGGRAFYEFQAGMPQATTRTSNNDSREKAAPLAIAEGASGAVALGRLEHWYRLSVPQGVNTLNFELSGDPTVRTILALFDQAGNEIVASKKRNGQSPGLHRYEALVEPGKEVWVRISEPPRNVVFSWDTSGSVGAYIPRIYNSVMAFSGEVQPEYEWVNLLPFAMPFLLRDWSDNPQVLQTVLNDYRQTSASSAAEKSVFTATRALAPRPGTKAIVLVTDAVTPYFGDMWIPMAEIQPRIFGVGVAGSGIEEQNRFRDWAAVNGGDYRQLRYLGEMDVAFDRASTMMHRPADYSLLVHGEFREAPGPGRLQVVAGDLQSQNAVELILDASGSMLQRIDGKRRINVAKEVLTEAVREHIPPGTPVALRVFGHKEVDSCRTDLEIPLGPLDPEAAVVKIAGINAMNLAKTPIADSLAAVEKDLKGTRSGAVVLVTDGEETCDGDPAAVIQALQDKGFDVNLNIVGFAINDEDLAAQFESWAEAGGGRYFAADNEGGLSTAIRDALKVPFTVYDQGGNEVGTGQVGGEPLELERGIYSVVVRTQPLQRFDEVQVRGEDRIELKLE